MKLAINLVAPATKKGKVASTVSLADLLIAAQQGGINEVDGVINIKGSQYDLNSIQSLNSDGSAPVDISGLATKEEVTEATQDLVSTKDLSKAIEDFATKEQVVEEVKEATKDKA